jgi:hypothetical protein
MRYVGVIGGTFTRGNSQPEKSRGFLARIKADAVVCEQCTVLYRHRCSSARQGGGGGRRFQDVIERLSTGLSGSGKK